MNINPEFQRNIWLECSFHKLIMIPAILAIIFIGMVVSINDPQLTAISTTGAALTVYFILIGLWGVKLAANTVTGEVREKTWDNQRMTSSSAWSMTWAKLIGSTLIVWYGALFCLVFISIYYERDWYALVSGKVSYSTIEIIVTLILSGIFVQTTAFFAGLVIVRTGSAYYRSADIVVIFFSISTSIFVLNYVQPGGYSEAVSWYGYDFDASTFLMASLFIFTGWVLYGSYRVMRLELQLKNTPIAWLTFIIFMATYSAGFLSWVPAGDRLFAMSATAYSVVLVSVYIGLFSENKGVIVFKRLFYHYQQRRWLTFFQSVQTWMVSLVVLVITLLLLLVQSDQFMNIAAKNSSFQFMLINSSVFLLRDIGIVLYFNFAARPGKSDLIAFFYLLLLYLLLPMLFLLLNGLTLISVLVPWGANYPYVSLVSGLLQLVVIVFLVIGQWKRSTKVVH